MEVPTYIKRVNHALEVWHHPCQRPWWLYVRTALPPAGTMVAQLFGFDFSDMVRGFLRPRLKGRSGRHGRSGNRGGKGKGIPDINEMAGEKFRGLLGFKKPIVSGPTEFLWVIDGLEQRALWYFNVFDASSDFIFNWSTAIQKAEYCKAKFKGGASQGEGYTGPSPEAFAAWPPLEIVFEDGGTFEPTGRVWGQESLDFISCYIAAKGVVQAAVGTTFAQAGIGFSPNLSHTGGEVASGEFGQEISVTHHSYSPRANAAFSDIRTAGIVQWKHIYFAVHSGRKT